MNKPTVKTTIAGTEYPMMYNLNATIEIYEKFGEDSKDIGKLLSAKAQGVRQSLYNLAFLISVFVNQGIACEGSISDTQRDLITPESILMFTTPSEIAACRNDVFACITAGAARFIKSEDAEKKQSDG